MGVFQSRLLLVLAAIPLVANAMTVQLSAEKIMFTVQVLDARSGKPVPSNHVLLFTGESHEGAHTRAIEVTTDASGMASFSVDLEKNKFSQVFVDWHSRCLKDPNRESLSLEQVHTQGLVLNQCSKQSSQAKPDLLKVYVRPETFWERMAH